MKKKIEESWSAFSQETAKRYLIDFGKGAETSKILSYEVLKRYYPNEISIIEFGCGNGQFIGSLIENYGLNNFTYIGVDFSESLLNAAKERFEQDSRLSFISQDIESFDANGISTDVCIFSHVVEILSCPEIALNTAKKISKKILIRWFEPPNHIYDTVELREMPVEEGKAVPYMRRKMSRNFYKMILKTIDCTKVDAFKDSHSTDEVHLLHF